MQRKTALHTFAVGNAAHGECFIEAAAFASNHDAGEDLDSLLVAFHHARVHADAVTDFKAVRFGLVLFLFDRVDDAVHNAGSRLAAGRTFSFGHAENANGRCRSCAEVGELCFESVPV